MKTILVIEDSNDIRENLAEILELAEYRVIVAENGLVGVRKATQEIPDLILCDVMMPELDGFGVLNILNQKTQTADVPFIFLTAKSERIDFRKGMGLGADDYIIKPFDSTELLKAVEMRLEKAERLKTSFKSTPKGLYTFIDEGKAKKSLERLVNTETFKKVKAKDTIFQEGEYPSHLYYVVSGLVKLFKTNGIGKEYILDIIKPGGFFGYKALIQEGRHAESATALEEAEINLISKDDFVSLLHNNRDFAAKFTKLLVANTVEYEERLLSLAYHSIRRRSALSLLFLQKRQQSKSRSFAISRNNLAALVGTTKESISRTLAEFKDEKLIEIQGREIVILNAEKLENMPD